MAKYGEGVVCILGVPVIDGQAYWCCPSCQCTGNGICSGLGRLGNELLWCWCWIWGHVSGTGLIMVRLENSRRGVIQNQLYLGNYQSNLLQIWIVYSWGCALPLGGVVFTAITSWGCTLVCKMHWGWFSDRKTGKDTTWSVPIVFWSDFWMSSVLHDCNPVVFSLLPCEKIDFPFVSQNSPVGLESFTQGCHHDVLCSVV